jgi:hypothetical protein
LPDYDNSSRQGRLKCWEDADPFYALLMMISL